VFDIHCHILPEVDDGPKSWETAETMCRMSAQDGIEHIVAALSDGTLRELWTAPIVP